MELQFHDVAKRYGAKEALRGIDLTLTPGVYGLLGPNGAGKSTLMNILTGNLRPTRGHVTLDGQDTVSMGEAFRRRLGYCPQQQALGIHQGIVLVGFSFLCHNGPSLSIYQTSRCRKAS